MNLNFLNGNFLDPFDSTKSLSSLCNSFFIEFFMVVNECNVSSWRSIHS